MKTMFIRFCKVLLFTVGFFSINSYSQVTIFEETFNSPSSSNWSAGAAGNCGNAIGTFRVQGGAFVINQVKGFDCCNCIGLETTEVNCGNNQNEIRFSSIDLTDPSTGDPYCNVTIFMDVTVIGDMECSNPLSANCEGGQDQITLDIDGFGRIPYCCGPGCSPSFIIPLSLDVLNLTIFAGAQAKDEEYRINNIRVTGISGPSIEPITPVSSTVCSGASIVLEAEVNGCDGDCTFIWETPTGNIPSNTPELRITNAQEIDEGQYVLRVTTSECTIGDFEPTFLIVSDEFEVFGEPFATVCESSPNIALQTGPFLGQTGTWSGDHVSNNSFNVQQAGVGYHELLFTTDDCGAEDLAGIEVVGGTDADLGDIGPFCADDPVFDLQTTIQGVTGNWSGNGINNNTFDPSLAGEGNWDLSFFPDASEDCLSNAEYLGVMVSDCSMPSVQIDTMVCNGGKSITSLDFTALVGESIQPNNITQTVGTTIDTNPLNNVDFDGIAAGEYSWEYQSPNPPNTLFFINVTVSDAPNAGDPLFPGVCIGETTFDLFSTILNPSSTNGIWRGPLGSGLDLSEPSSVDISSLNSGVHAFSYKIDDGFCLDSVDISLFIAPTFTASFQLSDGTLEICHGDCSTFTVGTNSTAAEFELNFNIYGIDFDPIQINMNTYSFQVCLEDVPSPSYLATENRFTVPQNTASGNVTLSEITPSEACDIQISDPSSFTLTAIMPPDANQIGLIDLCAAEVDSTCFDLSTLNNQINDTETVAWYEGQPSQNGMLIANPQCAEVGLSKSIWAFVMDANSCENEVPVEFATGMIDASFEYPDFCESEDGLANPVTSGGVFRLVFDPENGTTIDPMTGTITGAVGGAPLEVEYDLEAICPNNSSTRMVNVFATPSLQFSANTISICEGLCREIDVSINDSDVPISYNVLVDGLDLGSRSISQDINFQICFSDINSPILDINGNVIDLPNNIPNQSIQWTNIQNTNCSANPAELQISVSQDLAANFLDTILVCPTTINSFDLSQINTQYPDLIINWYDGDPNSLGPIIPDITSVDLNQIPELWVEIDNGSCISSKLIEINITDDIFPSDGSAINYNLACENDTVFPNVDIPNGVFELIDDSGGSAIVDPQSGAISGASAGEILQINYSVDSLGCTFTTSITVEIQESPIISTNTQPKIICSDQCDSFSVNIDKGVLPVIFDIEVDNNTVTNIFTDVTLVGLLVCFSDVADPNFDESDRTIYVPNSRELATLSFTNTISSNGCSAAENLNIELQRAVSPDFMPLAINQCINSAGNVDLTSYNSLISSDENTITWYDGVPTGSGEIIANPTDFDIRPFSNLWIFLTNGQCSMPHNIPINVIDDIFVPDDDYVSYDSVCENSAIIPNILIPGGVFSVTSGNASIDPNSGEITGIDAGEVISFSYSKDTLNCTFVFEDRLLGLENPSLTSLESEKNICSDDCQSLSISVEKGDTPIQFDIDVDGSVIGSDSIISNLDLLVCFDDMLSPRYISNDFSIFLPETNSNSTVNLINIRSETLCENTVDLSFEINLLSLPEFNDVVIDICESDASNVDLTSYNQSISSTNNTITWFDDDPMNNGMEITESTSVDLNNQSILWLTIGNDNNCTRTESIQINISSSVASVFSYGEYCDGDVLEPFSVEVQGGVFSYIKPADDPSLLNPNTGEITNYICGSEYEISYLSPDLCSVIGLDTVIVGCNPISAELIKTCSTDLLFYGVDIIKTNSNHNINLMNPPSGVTQVSINDTLRLSNIPIGQEVSFTILNGEQNCSSELLVISPPDCSCPVLVAPTISPIDTAICETQNIPSFIATGLSSNLRVNWYDAATGGTLLAENVLQFDPLDQGVFFAETIDPFSNCTSPNRTSINLRIDPPSNAGNDGVINICESNNALINFDDILGDHNTGVWSLEDDPAFSLADARNFDPSTFASGSYSFLFVTDSGAICPSDSARIILNIEEQNDAGNDMQVQLCASEVVDLLNFVDGDQNGNFTDVSNTGALNVRLLSTGLLSEGDYIFLYTLPDANFCTGDQSEITITIIEEIIRSIDDSYCDDTEIVINGVTYNRDNPFGTERISGTVCDTIVNIDLQYFDSSSSDLAMDLCPGEDFILNGITFDESQPSGEVILNRANQFLCDSTINVSLNYFESYTNELSETICEGESITIGGQTVSTDGVYFNNLLTQNGCDSIEQITVIVRNCDNQFLFNSGDIVCFGDSTGFFEFSFSEAMLPFDFEWNEVDGDLAGNGTINNLNENIRVENLPSGQFHLIVRDGLNQEVENIMIPILEESQILINFNEDSSILCPGDNNAALSVDISGGSPGYDVLWSTGSDLNTISDLAPGLYSVRVVDSNNCTTESEYEIEDANTQFIAFSFVNPLCDGVNDGLITIDVDNPINPP